MTTIDENKLPLESTPLISWYVRYVTARNTGKSVNVLASSIKWLISNVDGLQAALDAKATKATKVSSLAFAKSTGNIDGSGIEAKTITLASQLDTSFCGFYNVNGEVYTEEFGYLYSVIAQDDTIIGESPSGTTTRATQIIYSDRGVYSRVYISGSWGAGRFMGASTFSQSKTRAELEAMITAQQLQPGYIYKYYDHENDQALLLEASTNNTFYSEGVRLGLVPRHYIAGSFNGHTWLGVFHTGLTPNFGDYCVYCGRVWRNTSGNLGAVSGFDLDSNWTLEPVLYGDFYDNMFFGVEYDFELNYISYQWNSDNKLGENYADVSDGFKVEYNDWNINADGKCLFVNNELLRFYKTRIDTSDINFVQNNKGRGVVSDCYIFGTFSNNTLESEGTEISFTNPSLSIISNNLINGVLNGSIKEFKYNTIINSTINTAITSVTYSEFINSSLTSCVNTKIEYSTFLNCVFSNKTFTGKLIHSHLSVNDETTETYLVDTQIRDDLKPKITDKISIGDSTHRIKESHLLELKIYNSTDPTKYISLKTDKGGNAYFDGNLYTTGSNAAYGLGASGGGGGAVVNLLTSSSLGGEFIDDTSSADTFNAYTINAINNRFANYVPTSLIGSVNGVAELDENGKVLASQLPLGETSSTAYRGDRGATAYADRFKWDGGSTGLDAATGRSSLGLGSAALRSDTYFALLGGSSSQAFNVSTLTASSFIQATTAKFTNLTDGYLPYHVNDAVGLGNSPVWTNETNVGIGTTSPTSVLHTYLNYGTNDTTLQTMLTLERSSANNLYAGGGASILFKLRDIGAGSADMGKIGVVVTNNAYAGGDARPAVVFYTGNSGSLSESMRINYLGNVGIGYSSGTEIDSYKLAVNGSGFYNGNLTLSSATDTFLQIGGAKIVWDGTALKVVGSDGTTPVSFYATGSNAAYGLGTSGGGGLTEESDPIFVASPAHGITSTKITNWDAAYTFVVSGGDLQVDWSGDIITGNSFVKVGGTASQFLKANGSLDSTVYEPTLGNPSVSGYLLSSNTAGVRSWVAPYSHPDYSIESDIAGTLGHIKATERTKWNETSSLFTLLGSGTEADPYKIQANYAFYSLYSNAAYGLGTSGGGGGAVVTLLTSSSLGGTFIDDTSSADTFNAYTINAINNRFANYVPTSLIGSINGVAELDENGKVLASQLPSYVDDVIEVTTYSALPSTGESGKIYICQDTNITYRWTGTGYAEISSSLALGETSSTAYRGDRGATAYADRFKWDGGSTGLDAATGRSSLGLGAAALRSDTYFALLGGSSSQAFNAWGYRFYGYSTASVGVVTTNAALYALADDNSYGYGISTNSSGGLDIMANQQGQIIRLWAGTDNFNPTNVAAFSNGAAWVNGILTATSYIKAPTAKFTNLHNGYLPYVTADGLVDSVLYQVDGNLSIGSAFRFSSTGTLQWGSDKSQCHLTWDTGYVAIYGRNGNSVRLGVDNTPTLCLTSQNDVLIGYTSNPASYKLAVNGSGFYNGNLTSSAYYIGSRQMVSNYSWGGDNTNVWLGGATNSTVTGTAGYEGNYLVAIGVDALHSNTTGNSNNAIGVDALYSNTTGNYNNAIGVNALLNNTTGYFNNAIGVNAGRFTSNGNNTSSLASIYLGYNTKALNDGDTNEIVIGHEAVGHGSNTATWGNTSITNNYFSGSATLGSATNTFLQIGGARIVWDGTALKVVGSDGTTPVSFYATGSNAAYGLGTSGGGGLIEESDPIFVAHAAYGITATKINHWDAAYTFVTNGGDLNADFNADIITASSFVKVGGTGANILLDNGTTVAKTSYEAAGTMTTHTTTYNHNDFVTAYNDRLKWDGGAIPDAATARTSLGLVIGTDVLAYRTFGSAANNNTGDFEPAITKSAGFLKWSGSAWVWDTNTYVTGTPWTSEGYLTAATLPVASDSVAGIVSTTTQTFAGSKSFNNGIKIFNSLDETSLYIADNSSYTKYLIWVQDLNNPIFLVNNSGNVEASSYAIIGGTGTNLLVDDGSVVAASNFLTSSDLSGYATENWVNTNYDTFPGFGTTSSTAAYGNHDHSGVYATASHNHNATYAALAGSASQSFACSTLSFSNLFISALNTPPTSSGATGTEGEIRICWNGIYVCIGDDTWVKATLSTW